MRRMRNTILAPTLVLLCWAMQGVAAEPVKVELIADTSGVRPGQALRVGAWC